MATGNLQSIPIFIDLNEQELMDVEASCTPRNYPKNSMIILEEEFGDTVFGICEGTVKITRVNDEGKEVILALLGPGEIFGEMAIIDEKPRSASIKALEKTILKVFNRNEFLNILQEDQDVSITILSSLFNRLREANVKILQLEAKGPTSESGIDSGVEDEYVDIEVTLEGLTKKAINALPENPYRINQFPFV